MKKHLSVAMAVMFLVGALGVSVQAQGASSQRMVATIPFSFNVGKTIMPAGKYTITVINPSSDRRTLQIRSADGRSTAMIQTNSVLGQAADDAKLVFHRYGDLYFFAEAQLAGDTTTLAAIKSSAEKQQQAVAKAGTSSVVVRVAE
jgi:hypothetical protein